MTDPNSTPTYSHPKNQHTQNTQAPLLVLRRGPGRGRRHHRAGRGLLLRDCAGGAALLVCARMSIHTTPIPLPHNDSSCTYISTAHVHAHTQHAYHIGLEIQEVDTADVWDDFLARLQLPPHTEAITLRDFCKPTVMSIAGPCTLVYLCVYMYVWLAVSVL